MPRLAAGWAIISVSFFGLFLYFGFTNHISAKAESPWNNTDELKLELVDTLGSVADMPYRILGNRDCQNRTITTKPGTSHTSCAVDTGYGSISQSGYMQRAGSSVWGKISGTYTLLPTPRQNSALILTNTTSSGSYVAFVRDAENYLSSVPKLNGEVIHYLAPNGIQTLKGHNGKSLRIRYDSLAYSANGLWAVADAPGLGMTRINMETGEVLVFGPAVSYTSGLVVGWQTAVSTDGKYAAIYSYNFDIFRVYNLASCMDICQYLELSQKLKRSIDGYRHISNIRFAGDITLDFYASSYDQSGAQVIGHYLLGSGSPNHNKLQYLGLGDSFASGEGAFNYKAFTDTDENKCHVSYNSYPYLIGAKLNMDMYESVACSGAKQKDVVDLLSNYNEEHSQAKGKVTDDYDIEIMNGFLPGYRIQKIFIDEYKAESLTISISGNDIGFGDIIKSCVSVGTCYNTYQERKQLMRVVDQQFDSLSSLYSDLKKDSAQTRIYALGYPKVAYPDGVCEPNVRLNKQELKFANDLVHYLNGVIKQAAKKSGVYYVDVEDAFVGYRLCEPIAHWEVAINGLTAGNDNPDLFNGPIANESYHPNALGHRLYKKTVLEKTNNLSAPMPKPQPEKHLSVDHESSELLVGFEKPLDTAPLSFYDPNTSDSMFFQDQDAQISPTNKLSPGSSAEVWLHSTPIKISNFTVGSNGVLTASFTVPRSIEPGYHTLHILGTNISGETVDIYDFIYVAASPEDFDGDGVLNTDEQCLFGEPTGSDKDGDGIDDACDGLISSPPAPAKTNDTSANSAGDVSNVAPDSGNKSMDFIAIEQSRQNAGEDATSSENSGSKGMLLGDNSNLNKVISSELGTSTASKTIIYVVIAVIVIIALAIVYKFFL